MAAASRVVRIFFMSVVYREKLAASIVLIWGFDRFVGVNKMIDKHAPARLNCTRSLNRRKFGGLVCWTR